MGDRGLDRNLDVVFDLAALHIGTRQQVRNDVNAIAALALVDFNFIGVQNGDNEYLAARSRFYRNRSINVGDRNTCLARNRKSKLFSSFGHGNGSGYKKNHKGQFRFVLPAAHVTSPNEPIPSFKISTAVSDLPLIGKALTSVLQR